MNLDHTTAAQYLHIGALHLNPAQRVALETHLAGCADCRAYAGQLAELAPRLSEALHARWGSTTVPAAPAPVVQSRARRQTVVKQGYAAGGILAGALLMVVFAFTLSSLLAARSAVSPVAPLAPTAAVRLGKQIVLERFTLEPTTLQAGEPVTVSVQWYSDGPLTKTYAAFVHLLREPGNVLAASFDSEFVFSSRAWTPQARYSDTFAVMVPADFPVGEAQVFLGAYDPDSQERLPIVGGESADSQLKLGQVTVLPPAPSAGPIGEKTPPAGRIVFMSMQTGNSEIYVVNADGTGLTNLTNNPASDYAPSVSPDGQRIAFASNRDGRPELWVMQADGSALTKLALPDLKIAGFAGPFAWLPGGKALVVSLALNETLGNGADQPLFLLQADGSGYTRLTDGNDVDPQPSPDGRWVAFTHLALEQRGAYVVAPATTASHSLLLTASDKESVDALAWSPDCTQVAFYITEALGAGRYHGWIKVMPVGGAANATASAVAVQDLGEGLEGTRKVGALAWSPDGTQLAFVSLGETSQRLYRMAPDGTGLQAVTVPWTSISNIGWTPDGQWIIFLGGHTAETTDIYLVNVSGTQTVRLTQSGQVFEPQWQAGVQPTHDPVLTANPPSETARPTLPSPSAGAVLALSSAERLAFETSRDGNWEIYLTAGGELQNLTQNAANDGNPMWAPDGQKILFFSDRSGQNGYYLMNADGSRVRPVPTGKAISFSQGAWSPNGQWLAGVSEPTATGPAQLCVVSILGDEKSRCVEWRTEDGGASSTLTETVTALPQWSSDGQFVAFTFWHGGTGQVIVLAPWQNGPACAFALNAPANTDRRLVAGAPQGNRLAYLSSAGGQEVSLNIVRVLGVNQVMTETSVALLPDVPLAEYGDLAWSPDGQRLLFTIDWQGLQLYQIYVVNADGTGLTRLGDNLDFAQPVWSPDSRWIAFSRRLDLGAAADIYQLDVEAALRHPGAAAITRLTYTHGGANFHPQWQPHP